MRPRPHLFAKLETELRHPLRVCIRYDASGEKLVKWSLDIGAWIREEEWRETLEIFPGYEAPLLIPDADHPIGKIARAKWGAQPFWTKDEQFGRKNAYNARDDSLGPTPKLTKPTWRESFFKRRCIVPATAFYERINIGTPQAQWVRFRDPSNEVLAIAGLFEEPNELSILPSYAMVTTEPNARVGAIHDRMPVLLSMEDARSWMDKEAEPEELLEMLQPCPDEWVEYEAELLISEHRRLTKERRAAEQAGLVF